MSERRNTIIDARARTLNNLHFTEALLSDTAHQLEARVAPDELVLEATHIDLANNHQYGREAWMGGGNYGRLDISTRFLGFSETDARVEGLKLSFFRYNAPGELTLELVDYDEQTTSIADIPFAVIPPGFTNPVAKVRFEDVLFAVDDLVQYKKEDLLGLIDPRYLQGVSFSQVVYELVESLSKKTTKTQSKRRYESFEPVISFASDAPFLAQKKTTLDINRKNGTITSLILFVGAQQELDSETIEYGYKLLHNKISRGSQVQSIVKSEHETLPIDALQEDSTDILGRMNKSLEDLIREKTDAN